MRRSGHPASVPALGAVLVAVTIAAAACGTVGQPEASRGRSGQAGPKSMPTANGPAAGSRGLALRTSARLLKDLALPLGSRPAGARELPDPLRRPAEMPGSSHLVQRHEVMAVPASAKWLLRHLSQHPPGGLISTGSGMSSGPSWPVLTFLSWSPRRLPAGLYQANLVVSVLPAGRAAALVRADAQVIWYPPRSRAEYVTPGRFAAARLWEHLFNPRPHTVRMIVTSRAMIARLARTLDVLHADPGIRYACPAITAEYRVTFVPRTARQPQVVAVPDGCNSVGMRSGGTPQPDLTGGYVTITWMSRLLGITKATEPAARH